MRAHCTGVGLIEALAALVVMGIGLLGMAALLVRALGAVQASVHRQAAIVLTDDLAARIRSAGASDAAMRAEMDAWRGEVERRLPAGRARITRVPRDRLDVLSVVVGWQDPGGLPQWQRIDLVVPR